MQKRNRMRTSIELENNGSVSNLLHDHDLPEKSNASEEDPGIHTIITENHNTSSETHAMIIEETPDSNIHQETITTQAEDPWLFGQSAEDSAGLSWLARLFVQLETEEMIPSASLEAEKEEDREEREFVSGMELKELFRTSNRTSTFVESYSARKHDHHREVSCIRYTTPWSTNAVTFQSSWSPFFETDIFSKLRNAQSCGSTSWAHSWTSLEGESIECQDKLAKLEKMLPANSPGIIRH